MVDNRFPLEKILNVTPTEYCASVGRELNSYELRGIHATTGYKGDTIVEVFAELVPREAEVVVNYRPHFAVSQGGFLSSAYKIEKADGVALIPKEE